MKFYGEDKWRKDVIFWLLYLFPNVIQLTDFWIKTVYHNLPNIENTIQLGNSGINKWAFTSTPGV